VGMAGNGKEAIAMIDELAPDLVTLDVNMPVMDGISTIKHIMIKKPCPVVIMSNPGDGSTKTIFHFLELGAVDFMSKPTKNQDILIQQQKILERISLASTAKVRNFRIARIPKADGHSAAIAVERACRRLVVVISGPGGHPEQLSLLSGLIPAMLDINGAVVALQSLPPAFIEAYAHYLGERCAGPVTPINRETPVYAGHCYVGVHGAPLMVKMNGQDANIDFGELEKNKRQIERFLSTAAVAYGKQLTVVLLSGADTGEQAGLRVVKENGGRIVLRQRSSSLVAEPLDPVFESSLADEEVKPADLVKTILKGFDRKG
jgi:two-component system, chemotaxis family, protein-glutamate methylesterase/glutaminase